MRERTFIMSLIALDMMCVMGGGVMAWAQLARRSLPGSDSLTAALAIVITAGVGSWVLYEVNLFSFRLAESVDAGRNARWIAIAFAAAVVVGTFMGWAGP
ncbi:MAG: hypothetical protein ABIV28_04155 [Longimicrobiales bacterium]